MQKRSSIFQVKTVTVEKLYRIVFYLICTFLLVSSLIKVGGALNRTKIEIGEIKLRMDYLLHAVAYFIFSLYYIAGKYFGLKLFKRRRHGSFFLIIFLLGFLAETLQIWIPSRSFNVMDLLSNLTGIALGLSVTVIILRQKGKSPETLEKR